jgi:high-affinity nickel-transport protein
MEISGILIMLALGLRHGLDPDHIAVIDGVSMRFSVTRPVLTKWVGTLFAIGHGATVTGIAVMISLVSHSWHLPQQVWGAIDWVPGLILILVGLVNLHQLRQKNPFSPKGWRTFLVPEKLKNSSHPLAIILIGVLFAVVFDTTTQAAAWAYTGTGQKSTSLALLLGLTFSCGMITTDTLDSRILFQLIKRSGSGASAKMKNVTNYRRSLGWIIACLSITVGGYETISHIVPSLVIDDSALTMLGLSFFIMMLVFYTTILYNGRKLSK